MAKAPEGKYFLAPSLVDYRNEINALWPNRDRTSDGWIGDTAHSARKSDHNPDWSDGSDSGIVRAIDIDIDGIDAARVLDSLIGHAAVQYVIHKGKIWSRSWGWTARKYNGSNRHDKHIHVSIVHSNFAEHWTGVWLVRAAAKPSRATPRPPVLPRWYVRVIRPDMRGNDVKSLQLRMNKYGQKLIVDGHYGPKSVASVKLSQRNHKLKVDGIVGPVTARHIGG
jgi:hypothetical protein